jgi:hypothetical protein
MNYRQKIIDLVLNVLGDPAIGFNAQYQAKQEEYGVPECVVQWELPSPNLILGTFDPELLELVRIESWPAIVIATEEATKTNAVKFSRFSGEVIVTIDGYIRLRAVDDPNAPITAIDLSGDFEKHVNCFEDAMTEALDLGKPAFQANGVNWTQFQSTRSAVGVLADGYTQRASLTLGFNIHL